MGRTMWTEDFEPVRRQRGGRGGPRRGSGGPGGRGSWGDQGWGSGWGAGWGGPMGGPPPWVTHLFGPDASGRSGAHGPHGRRNRRRRGDVRTAILAVLHDAGEPINGYQAIQQIAERSNGIWKPSPGSVYPTIAQLQDEGLLEDAPAGRKALQLTDEGRDWIAEHASEIDALWEPFAEDESDAEAVNFKQVIGQTVGAFVQVMTAGNEEQRKRALAILDETRRNLYGLLAEEADDEVEDQSDEDPDTDDDAQER